MKPGRILLFILSVFCVLLLVSVSFPKDGISLGKDFTLYFPTLQELFVEQEEKVDVKEIVELQEAADSLVQLMAAVDSSKVDSVIPIDQEELKKLVHQIEFPNDDPTVLNSFFDRLKNIKDKGELIRIMHYGDSQIEGDRITAFLRSRLQGQFGGYGIGLIPVKQPYDFSFSIKQSVSDNWLRYTINGKVDTSVKHKNYGPLAAFSRFTPVYSIPGTKKKTQEAWIEIEKSRISYAATKNFKRCRIFYGNSKDSVGISVYNLEELILSDTLKRGLAPQVYEFAFDDKKDQLKIVFKGKESPDIYGISLESTDGIVMDNIGLRGSSGTIFTKIERDNLKTLYNDLNTRLFILQFGGNVMPYIEDDEGVENYGRWFCNQIARIKSLCPDAAVIVIGPSDMSIKKKDKYVTYEHLEDVRDALKSAAFEAHAAYWDMFEAMGGKNSMPSWVEAEPALAAPDYTHFTSKGVTVISNMFYNAFLFEYNNYKSRTQ